MPSEAARNRNELSELNTLGHLRMGLGSRGRRNPEDDDEGEGGGGSGLLAHPAFMNTPEGAADKNISANTNVNDQAEKEMDAREHDLTNDLRLSHANRAKPSSAPTLTRR